MRISALSLEFGRPWWGSTMMQRTAEGDRPGLPLHNSGSGSEIRCRVAKRKIPSGARSQAGRDRRDAFFGQKKYCAERGIPFRICLGNRSDGRGAPPPLPDLIRQITVSARLLG